MTPFSLNIKGKIVTFDRPLVMGIINVTPDSFFAGSRTFDDSAITARAAKMVADGVDIIDIGAYSTRPGAAEVTAEEEGQRLCHGLKAIRTVAPDILISVDTFRADVARKAITEWGADIINDVSGGDIDPDMFDTVAELNVPYVLMHMRGTPADMQEHTDYVDVTADVLAELGEKVQRLAMMGVSDIIIDPGFGFSKTLAQNYELMNKLEAFNLFHRPVLVGISRKSMATKLLKISTDDALNATTVLNVLALDRGAAILRVHDVEAARQAVAIYQATIAPKAIQQ
jgi:dihydropteroate synthase